ncbi:MAG: glycerol-3-phosphate dehydrogenase/oxidase [Actinomycetota bacterium]|nr:glycerol-3-phosphate dehydrogenase/oxidase [Actinomycetota bacterium]MDA3000323.1 glycerol-3-phosphate dehydrogenase/oxidase [Actinomycetota bacterium]
MSTALRRPVDRLGDEFDVVVVGGGITGTCVAREAASRGLRVALVERSDFGSGTSSATTKFIHGGIRYLEQYDVAVVRESLRERRILALGAPHLVEQTQFIMPAWRWSKPPTPLLGAGVALYHTLSFDRNRSAPPSLRIPIPRWLSRSDLLGRVPWLDPESLQGGFAYHDTLNVHPERLLLAYARSAAGAGAVLVNHCEVTGFHTEIDGDTVIVKGVDVVDRLDGRSHRIHASVVVNAAGPWIEEVLGPIGRNLGVGVDRSKGVHVLTRPLGGGVVKDAVFARARSGRHVIVSPWMGKSFIGPTDTPMLTDDPVTCDPEDVEQILDTVNSTMSPSESHLTFDDVELTTVGVRPLIKVEDEEAESSQSSDTYSASRRHELHHHLNRGVANLWTIAGGKWTTARATAEDMVDELFVHELSHVKERSFGSRTAPAHGTFAWAEDAEPFMVDAVTELTKAGVPNRAAEIVVRAHGTDYRRILDLVTEDPRLAETLPGSDEIAAQIVVAVVDEAARTLADVIDRRLITGTTNRVDEVTLRAVADVVAPLLGWSDGTVEMEVDRERRRRESIDAHWRTRRP